MTVVQIMDTWRGIDSRDICHAMDQLTFGVSWKRSPKREIAELLSGGRRKLRPGFTVEDVAVLARQRACRRDEWKREAAGAKARRQSRDEARRGAMDAKFCGLMRRQTSADFIRFAQGLWGMLDPSSQSRFLRTYEK